MLLSFETVRGGDRGQARMSFLGKGNAFPRCKIIREESVGHERIFNVVVA